MINPDRTSLNRGQGPVLALIDLDVLRIARSDADSARAFAESVIEAVKTPLLIMNEDCRVVRANGAFYEGYGLCPPEVENQLFHELDGHQWDLPELRSGWREFLSRRVAGDLEIEHEIKGRGKRTLCLNMRPLESSGDKLILLAVEDITTRKQAERALLAEQEYRRFCVTAGATELREAGELLQAEVLGREQVETALYTSEHALLQSREELRRLSASLMNAQDAERRRISRELHDDLSQRVAKLQFDIETLAQQVPFVNMPDARLRLHDVGNQAAGLSNELRRVAHQLHPATLDHLGLTVALRGYAEEFSRSTAIPVKFTSLRVPRNIPIELASGLYRIVQEALRNVRKHASDAKVEIMLARDPTGLTLFVRDNGNGFEMKLTRSNGGLGLISMEERVRLLGGTFVVETQPGKGVLIAIQCPLPEGLS